MADQKRRGSTRGSARSGSASSDVDLTPHPLAPTLDEAAAQPGDSLSRIVGFIGVSEDDRYVRIYLDLSFSSYCEVAREDVMRTASVDGGDPNSPTIVWIGESARVGLVSVQRLSGDAASVAGRLRNRYSFAATGPRRFAASELETVYDWGGVCTQLFDCPVPGGPPLRPVPVTTDDPLSCSHIA